MVVGDVVERLADGAPIRVTGERPLPSGSSVSPPEGGGAGVMTTSTESGRRRRRRGSHAGRGWRRGGGLTMNLPLISIRRPVFAFMLIASLVVLGLISLFRLDLDLNPRVDFPFVTVTTILPGASPETMETEVTDILEEEINTIEGIRTLGSNSMENLSNIFIEFELGYDIDVKAQQVREKIAPARRRAPARHRGADRQPARPRRLADPVGDAGRTGLAQGALGPGRERGGRAARAAAGRGLGVDRRGAPARGADLARPGAPRRLRPRHRRRPVDAALRERRDGGRPHRERLARVDGHDLGQGRSGSRTSAR